MDTRDSFEVSNELSHDFIVGRSKQGPNIVHVRSGHHVNLDAILDLGQADFNFAYSKEIVVPGLNVMQGFIGLNFLESA